VCGRYTLAAGGDPAQLRARFPIGEAAVRPRWNIAPGDEVLAVTTDREGAPRGELLRWGLVPSWADSPALGLKLINARVETVAEKPAFRGAFERFRCLVPADGFYEWQQRPGLPKQPFHITRSDRRPFAFAGLWSKWRERDAGRDAPALRTMSIITTAANEAIAPLHDRMPVILDPAAEAAWLDPGTPPELLRELCAGLAAPATDLRPVGTAVNDARHDAPDCLEPPVPERQTSLF
jgi:putative SOS response-associated peptidase YedK